MRMKIVVSAQGDNLDAPASPIFGRCTAYVFVDTETMEFEAVPNPAVSQGGGAGIGAAQFVVRRGAQAVLTGNLGPNAFEVLKAAGVPGYLLPADGSVREAVEAYRAGKLQPMTGSSVQAHAGMGARSRNPIGTVSSTRLETAKESELAELRDTLKALRSQLADTMKRIDELERKA
jgi:predicted Fe-Mo cluster-binding NifX family protein